jgi:hypothetical protein
MTLLGHPGASLGRATPLDWMTDIPSGSDESTAKTTPTTDRG